MKSILTITILIFLMISSNYNISSKGNSFRTDSNLVSTDTVLYCIVSKEKIEGSPVKYTYLGTKVTFCCEGCEKSFKKNPAKYLKNGIKDPVCGMTEVNDTVTVMSEGVKYYFCSVSCKKNFEKDASKYLAKYYITE